MPPKPPKRQYSFTAFQTSNPKSASPPGDRLDGEHDRTNTAVEQTIAWVSKSLGPDGSLRPGSVGKAQLVPGISEQIGRDVETRLQPLANQAAASAASARTACRYAAAAADRVTARNEDLGRLVADTHSDATDAAASAEAAAASAAAAANSATSASNAAGDAAGSAALATDWGTAASAWAEHMPDPIPAGILAATGVTGDHWSARWWANQAATIVEAAGVHAASALTPGTLPKAAGPALLGDSAISDDGTAVLVGAPVSQGAVNPNASYQGLASLSASYNEIAVYGDHPATNRLTAIAHDNTAGYLYTDSDRLNILAGSLVAFGISVLFGHPVTQFLTIGAPVTPGNNGDMTVQATSNTQLTFKLKGLDGVVRSGNLTLA